MQHRANTATLDYITRHFVQEPSWLQAVRYHGERLRPGMQLSAYEGHLLRWLVAISGATSILEIGSFMGYSTLWMAHGLPATGRIVTLEREAEHARQAVQHVTASPYARQIHVEATDALTWLAVQPLQPTYDFVFIDAEKRRYDAYLDAMLPLLKPGAWIVGDNTLLFGALSGERPDAASREAIASMQRFNATLADPARFESVLLPTLEGMTVARLRSIHG